MKKTNRLLAFILLLVLVLPFTGGGWIDESPRGDIVILATNDVHSGVDTTLKEDGGISTMGYANLAAYVKEMESVVGKDYVTLVDVGDSVQGEAIGTLSKGEYLIDIMNYVGYDLAVCGNHEFDYGMDRFMELAEMAEFPYVASNFIDLRANKPVFDAYEIFTYGGVKVAYVGVATPETFVKSTPAYFQDENGNYIYSFCEGNNGQDLYSSVQSAVDAAKKEGADYVIALAHLGIDDESKPFTSTDVIANTTGIDAVIDGHSHSIINGDTLANKNGDGVILVQAETKLSRISKVVIKTDGTIKAEVVSGYDKVDKGTDAFVKNIQASFEKDLNKVVATSKVGLYVNDPETGTRLVRSQETNLGNLCADAYRNLLGADIAFVNGGGVRADISPGDITYGQIIAVHPFGNMACLIETTGQQVLDALELGSSAAPGEFGGFLHVSGVSYTIDTTIKSPVVLDDKGSFVEISGARRVKDVKVGGVNIDPNKTYTLASHNYMLKDGGDGYTMFQADKLLQDEVLIDNQVLISYIVDVLGGVVGEEYSNIHGQGRINIILSPQANNITEANKITEVSKYGNITLDILKQDFIDGGYVYGDILTVKLQNGTVIEAPFVSNYSDVDNGSVAVLAREADDNISIAINMGNFAGAYGVGVGDSLDIEIKEKGSYYEEYLSRQVVRTDNRGDYSSDEVFANFRAVAFGGMAEDAFYRSSSPVNPELARNTYTDNLAKAAGIQTFINLADTEEALKAYEGYASSYYKTIFDKGDVIALNMGVDFSDPDFEAKLKEGLIFLGQAEGPVLIHCNEGKDRAGFVSAVLEALMGATLDEIVGDYMVTYENYYHVPRGSEKWEAIANSNIRATLAKLAGLEKGSDLSSVDFVSVAEAYLAKIGLTSRQISAIKAVLGTPMEAAAAA